MTTAMPAETSMGMRGSVSGTHVIDESAPAHLEGEGGAHVLTTVSGRETEDSTLGIPLVDSGANAAHTMEEGGTYEAEEQKSPSTDPQ